MIGSNFFTYLNAYDNLNYYRKLKGIEDKDEISRVLKLLELDKVTKPFKAYSLGMKQRLGIANALMGHPKVVVLDEPVNGLDPQGIAEFRNLIVRLNKEEGITFIVSSHILGELSMMATRFGFIDQGVLIEEISMDELHQRTRSALRIHVDDTKKASKLLEEVLGTKNYRIVSDSQIILTDYLEESNKVSKLMVENGIELYQIVVNETSLEDYYLNLIGGQNNA